MIFNMNDLNNLHLDVLKELGNIGAGNAATALAKMIDKKINMNVPETKVLEFSRISDLLGGAEITVTGILLSVTGDVKGNIMFILRESAAHKLVNLLLGQEDKDDVDLENSEFNEIELSALKEIGNILASSYLSALSTLTNLRMYPSVPDIAIDMAGAILSVPAIEFGKVGDTVLYIETEFSEGMKKIVGDFFLVPEIDSFDTLLKALGVAN